MDISEIKPRQGGISLKARVVAKGDLRRFEKFGREGRVCTAEIEDGSGKIKLTLWNEDVERIDKGDIVELENCYANEYRGEIQLTTGREGKIAVLEKQKGSHLDDSSDEEDSSRAEGSVGKEASTEDDNTLPIKEASLEKSRSNEEKLSEDPYKDEEDVIF